MMNSRIPKFTAAVMLILITIVRQSSQLECYVCQNQEDNKSKCAETVKICDLLQEQCLTEVRWGSKPHWAIAGQKQYFISKRCATRSECQEATADKNHKCDRIWYNDWNCTNCCSGDKCNYYVTLAGHSTAPMNLILMIGLSMLTAMFHCQARTLGLRCV